MKKHVCPWWLGYLLANPIRRIFENPEKILSPHIVPGMTVLDIGSGMGFFTIPAARMVGKDGRVIAVDLQQKMLTSLRRRAARAGVQDRVVTRMAKANSIGVSEAIDLCMAFHVLHELPDIGEFMFQLMKILKPGGRLMVTEPGKWHVTDDEFQEIVNLASKAGLSLLERPLIPGTRSAIFSRK